MYKPQASSSRESAKMTESKLTTAHSDIEQLHSLPEHHATNSQPDVCDLAHRIALNQLTTIRWTLDEDLEAYQLWNLPAMGVSWRKLLESGVQRGVRAIRLSGMTVSSVGWVGGFTGHNGFGIDSVIQEAKRAIRVAGQLRAPVVTVLTGPQNGHIDSHARRLACHSLRELADLAASYDVALAVQPMHTVYQKNWSFIHTLDDALELIERVDHPALKLAFGAYHLGDEADICTRMKDIVKHVRIVHLSDRSGSPRDENDREIPGEGCLPLREMITALESAGYDGWYETEVWSRDLWKMDHHDLIERCLRSQATLFSNEFRETVSGI